MQIPTKNSINKSKDYGSDIYIYIYISDISTFMLINFKRYVCKKEYFFEKIQ